MLDLELLRIIWWVLLGVLLMGFAVTDGFDLGVATLLPLVTRNDTERRVVLNTIGPFWEGNQVWIILGAGAIFAAWPFVYAVAFSGPYLAILLLLLTMGISRPVSFKYRSKIPNYFWRRFWDWMVFVGGLTPSFLFGLLVGNALVGLPFQFDDNLRITYTGTFWNLFSPFTVWCGLTSVFMLMMHGGLYLAIKTENPLRDRAIIFSRLAAIFLIVFFTIGGYFITNTLLGYQVGSVIDPNGYSNPLHKVVSQQISGWLQNYYRYPYAIIAPASGFLGAILACLTARWVNSRFAFICSALAIMGIISTVGVSMFPFILPSSINPNDSLLVWDASSSQLTLIIMLVSVIIFLPLILLYTSWVYYILRGKVKNDFIETDEQHTAY